MSETISKIIIPSGEEYAVEAQSLAGVTATAQELNYLSGVTGNIQEQFNNLSIPSAPELTITADEEGNGTISLS